MSEKTVLPSTTGLRGQSAGSTAVCTVGKEGVGLTYRGYTIEDLAQNASFEEVAFQATITRETRASRSIEDSSRVDPSQRSSDGCFAYRMLAPRLA